MYQESHIQYYALYYNIQRGAIPSGAYHLGIVLLMLQNSSGNMSADLAKIDGTASVTCNIIYHMGLQILIKR